MQIDAPEAGGECYAAASRRALVLHSGPGSDVVLEPDPALDRIDRFGRLLRYVHVAGRNANVELVRQGAATPWFYGGERGRYAFNYLQQCARRARPGAGCGESAPSRGARRSPSRRGRGMASLERGTLDSANPTFGSVLQDLKRALARADDAEL